MSFKNASKTLIYISIAWLLYSAAIYFLKLKAHGTLEIEVNLIETAVGFISAILLFAYFYKSKQFLSLGIGLAILSWTLGEIFWFSYEMIKGDMLPYPSVGEFGFLGTYFFIAGSIGNIKSNNKHRIAIIALAFLIMLIPVMLLFKSSNTLGAVVYNFIFISAIAFVLYKALSKYKSSLKYLFIGILLFCTTDITFIIEANVRDYTIICDMLYPLCFSILTYGAMKEGAENG